LKSKETKKPFFPEAQRLATEKNANPQSDDEDNLVNETFILSKKNYFFLISSLVFLVVAFIPYL